MSHPQTNSDLLHRPLTDSVSAVGLGFRRELTALLLSDEIYGHPGKPDFVEVAPENWIGVGGQWKKTFDAVRERYAIRTHGLSLSLGGPAPLNWEYLAELKVFLEEYRVDIFSEHLSYCTSANAHLHELLPLPFIDEAVTHISRRINEVQDFLERKIAIENISYYSHIAPEMTESEFINHILAETNCNLLLDVNNVYVNATNHGYNPLEFIHSLPAERIVYMHIAGHLQKSPTLIIDTHSEPVINDVYSLLAETCKLTTGVPVLLERDFNFSDTEQLLSEIVEIRSISGRKTP